MARATRRYLIIGVGVYLGEMAVILGAQAVGLGALAAVAVGFWSGLLLSFVLQKVLTFGDRRFGRKVIAGQASAFLLLVLFNFSFTLGLTRALSGVLPVVFIRTFAIGLTVIWNYYIYRIRIFRPSPRPVSAEPSC